MDEIFAEEPGKSVDDEPEGVAFSVGNIADFLANCPLHASRHVDVVFGEGIVDSRKDPHFLLSCYDSERNYSHFWTFLLLHLVYFTFKIPPRADCNSIKSYI